MTVGSVGLSGPFDPKARTLGEYAETADLGPLLAMLERGEFDLVGVGRAMIADPEWANEVRAGDMASLPAFDARLLEKLR